MCKETDKKYDSKLENPVTESTASRHNLAADISWPPSSYFEISINLKGLYHSSMVYYNKIYDKDHF